MKLKSLFTRLVASVAVLICTALIAASPAPVDAQEQVQAASSNNAQAAIGTAFTYQGRLNDNSNPANGPFDFQFVLFDAVSGGSQVSIALTKEDVAVSDGFFTVSLDFGSNVFTGDARFLDIGVRPGSSTGGFTMLSPRQAIMPAPYALALPGVVTRNGNVGIGISDPQAPLHVANAMRIQNNKFSADFAADEWGTRISTGDSTLYLRTLGNTHDFIVNNHAGDGNIYLGNSSNVTNVEGELYTGGKKPIFFSRYHFPTTDTGVDQNTDVWYDTGIPENEYNCGVVGWAATHADVREDAAGDYLAEISRAGGTWHIKATFFTHYTHEDWHVTIMCADTQLSEIRLVNGRFE